MKIIDGKKLAHSLFDNLSHRVKKLRQDKIIPCLAVVLIGDDPASHIYVQAKIKACLSLGIESSLIQLSASVSKEEILSYIHNLNDDDKVHGILVQLPLPHHLDENEILNEVHPAKDVDGFHPQNVSRLALGYLDGFIPCTPLGCLRLLEAEKIDLKGKEVVVLGRSRIVGRPLLFLLMSRPYNATVTLAHSYTCNLKEVCQRADILISAIGRPRFIDASYLKKGVLILDVGITRVDDETKEGGYSLQGDVCFEEVKQSCSLITPVPGGVGPMTIAMLMENTLKATELAK